MPRDARDHARSQSHQSIDQSGDEDIATTSGLVLPGGKVDADAIVRATQMAREQGLSSEDEEALRRVKFQLKHDLNKRLDKYLTDRIAFLSRTQLQKLIDEGHVLVNAVRAKSNTKLRAGDVVELAVPAPASKDIQPEDIPLEVMYEDEHIIVINKQPGIIVHPARAENTGTMLGALAYHFKHRSSMGGGLSSVGWELARPGVVHRLDRDTTGVIVFAKTEEAHWKLGHGFEHRRVDKRYLAVVHGHIEPDGFVIDLPLGPHQSREKGYREKQVVRHDELGKPSITIVRVRERYSVAKSIATLANEASHETQPTHSLGWKLPELPKTINIERANNNMFEAEMDRFSLVELELKTGRTHQIRVHLSHNLWPIVGDDMYGGKELDTAQLAQTTKKPARATTKTKAAKQAQPTAQSGTIARQMLHACMLSFEHPISGKRMTFQAPLRGDMAALVHTLRSLHTQRIDTPGTVIDLDEVV
jgi:23S rRNA pseudouridine1911/1915/1917 synthase